MSRNGGLLVSALALLTTGCATLHHAPASVKSELVVRVWVPVCPADGACASTEQRRYQGALIGMDRESLTLLAWQESDPALTLALASVNEIRLYRGRKPSAASAVKHGLVGAGVGALVGAAYGVPFSLFDDGGGYILKGAASGAAIGLVGGVLDGIFEGDERWASVSPGSLRSLFCLTNEKADCSGRDQRVSAW